VAPLPAAVKKKHHPDDMVRMYETLLHGRAEIDRLIGPHRTPEEAKLAAGELTLYKASRCYWLAQSFVAVPKWDQALALFERALQHHAKAKSDFAALPNPPAHNIEILAKLEKEITTHRSRARAKAFLEKLTQTKTNNDLNNNNSNNNNDNINNTSKSDNTDKKSSSLIAGLDTYDASFLAEKHLIDFPPKLEPIPVKPLLFDLAIRDLTFPNLEARKNPRKSFFGFWR